MKDIILIGGGGHCKSIADTIITSTDYNILGVIDIREKIGKKVYDNIYVNGCDEDLEFYFKEGVKYAFISVGSIGNTFLRRKLYKKLCDIGFEMPIIIDKMAMISKEIFIGEGTFIGKGSIINSNVSIGKNCIINTGSILEHDCNIGDFVHVSSGAVICGNVSVGNDSHIGCNATVIEGIKIGKRSIVGAGSVILRDIDNDKKIVGNPGRRLENEG